MSQKELDRYQIISKAIKKEITGKEAAEIIQVSYRHFKRLKRKVKKEGAKGLIHKNRGKESKKKIPQKERKKIIELISKYYRDFKPGFATEKLRENHNIKRDPKSIRTIMTEEGLWKPKKKRNKKEYHTWRKPKNHVGEMPQFDGSYEYWFEDRGPYCCLLLAIDDASGEIAHARFAYDEGVMSVFSFWKEYIEEKGCPRSIYLDKFSTYRMNQKTAKNNHDLLTQFQRACNQLGIEPISANSPQAKGRVERAFATLQDRLIKELRLEKINNITEANNYLKEKFIKIYNKKFARKPVSKINLHKKLNKREIKKLAGILSRQSYRVVQNDFTISFNNQWYQLTKEQPATICKKDRILVEERIDGEIKFKIRDKYLNVEELKERPRKADKKLWVIAKTDDRRKGHKPPPNHPWKRMFNNKCVLNN